MSALLLDLMNATMLLSAIVAVALTQSRFEERRRWAPIIGLIGQPFWLYITYDRDTWGPFLSSVFFTCIWLYGVWQHWPRQHWPRRRSALEFGSGMQ